MSLTMKRVINKKKKYKRKTKLVNTKDLVQSRLVKLSFEIQDHIYNVKLITNVEAAKYAEEIASYKSECENDIRFLQVIEKLTKQMQTIIHEQNNSATSTAVDIEMRNNTHDLNLSPNPAKENMIITSNKEKRVNDNAIIDYSTEACANTVDLRNDSDDYNCNGDIATHAKATSDFNVDTNLAIITQCLSITDSQEGGVEKISNIPVLYLSKNIAKNNNITISNNTKITPNNNFKVSSDKSNETYAYSTTAVIDLCNDDDDNDYGNNCNIATRAETITDIIDESSINVSNKSIIHKSVADNPQKVKIAIAKMDSKNCSHSLLKDQISFNLSNETKITPSLMNKNIGKDCTNTYFTNSIKVKPFAYEEPSVFYINKNDNLKAANTNVVLSQDRVIKEHAKTNSAQNIVINENKIKAKKPRRNVKKSSENNKLIKDSTKKSSQLQEKVIKENKICEPTNKRKATKNKVNNKKQKSIDSQTLNPLSWLSEIKYVRKIASSEYYANEFYENLDDSFWTDCSIPTDIADADFCI